MWASGGGVLTQTVLNNYLNAFYRKAGRMITWWRALSQALIDIYKTAGVGAGYGFLDARDGGTFRDTLQAALENDPDVIQLVTWNDYGEGTNIEPAVEYGYRYLEIIQETRRTAIDNAFSFTSDDLKLPLQLYLLRKQFSGNQEVNQRLDEAFNAIIRGQSCRRCGHP